jgi:phosphoribosylformimino-5-aminoimidazole carboxamide ribotide isomerase
MILYPAIDLKDGQCVRLLRGEMEAATVFGDDPAAQALKFQAAGCDGSTSSTSTAPSPASR